MICDDCIKRDVINCPYCQAEEWGISENWWMSPEYWDYLKEIHNAEHREVKWN